MKGKKQGWVTTLFLIVFVFVLFFGQSVPFCLFSFEQTQ